MLLVEVKLVMFVDFFDRVYVINLPSRTDRLHETIAELKSVGINHDHPKLTVFPAVRPSDPGGFRTVGARGCFLSHLSVLDHAVSRGHTRIMILEDDVKFEALAAERWPLIVKELRDVDRAIFYGGHRSEQPRMVAPSNTIAFPPDQAVLCTHCVAFIGTTVLEARDHLAATLIRPPGHPDGGPMDVDGAYSWFRRIGGVRSVAAVPALATQRASRTDISDARWYDKVTGIKSFVNTMRRLSERWRV